MSRILLLLGLIAAATQGAWAAWPYTTEPARTKREGGGEFTLGMSRTWQDSAKLPGGRGVLWRLPETELRLGVGPHAEVSANYEMLLLEPAGPGEETYESGDLRLWTKLAFFPSYVHGAAVRFGVKLPNASNERGLGTGEADIFLIGLYDFQIGPLTASTNLGMGILGDPDRSGAQHDVFTWATSLKKPLPGGFGFGGEAWGWVNRHHQPATFGLVGDWTWRRVRVSFAGRRGTRDARGWGTALGVTYTW